MTTAIEPTPNVAATPTEVPAARATPPGERAIGLDALRGVAILGILILNVRSFAGVGDGYLYPPAVGATGVDELAYAMTAWLAQSKFVTIFAALYGAGIILATRRIEEGGGRSWPTFARRSAILAAVGLGHLLFVWYGDILFIYAVVGLIAFPLRRLSTRGLWLAAGGATLLFVAVVGLLGLAFWAGATFQEGDPRVNAAELFDFDADIWRAETAAHLGPYSGQLAHRAGEVPFVAFGIVLFGPSVLGLMLAGMALLRSGFLTGGWSGRSYAITATVGLTVGVAASGALVWLGWRDGWSPVWWPMLGQLLGLQLAALPFSLGIAALVIGLSRGQGPLAATGRMAFTNYLAQSLTCTFIFYGGWGLGLFGRVGYAGQLGFVAGIWMVQVAFSVLWLRRFRYGPLEWLWRWATYGTRPRLSVSS